MSLLVGTLLFLVKFLIVFYFIARGTLISGMFSLLEPSDFGRKVNKSIIGLRGLLLSDKDKKIDQDSPLHGIKFAVAGLFAFAFILEPNFGFFAVSIGTAFSVWIRRNHKPDIMDERNFSQRSRILAASSELVFMVGLAFFLIFRLSIDVFDLLGGLFAIREILYSVFAQQLENTEFQELQEAEASA